MVRCSPGVNPKPRFGPILDSTGGGGVGDDERSAANKTGVPIESETADNQSPEGECRRGGQYLSIEIESETPDSPDPSSPSSVVKCLLVVFVWGFGVVYLSCACVCRCRGVVLCRCVCVTC